MTPAGEPAAKKPAARKRAPNRKAKKTAQRPKLQPELLEPWERQTGESDEAWQAWTIYRDQELPRSLRQVARHLSKSLTSVSSHSVRWQWVSRAQIWDVEQDRAKTRARLDEQEALGRRHATMAQGHLQALAAPMQELLRRLALPDADPQKIQLQQLDAETLLRVQTQAARAMPRVALAERLARGLNTEGPPAPDPAADMRRKTDTEIDSYLLGVDDGRATEAAKTPA